MTGQRATPRRRLISVKVVYTQNVHGRKVIVSVKKKQLTFSFREVVTEIELSPGSII